MNARVAFVGDVTSASGFRPLGLAVFEVERPEEALALWPELTSGRYGVVMVTEPVYAVLASLAAERADEPVPALTVIPAAGTVGGVGRERLERAIVRALGTSVPSGSED